MYIFSFKPMVTNSYKRPSANKSNMLLDTSFDNSLKIALTPKLTRLVNIVNIVQKIFQQCLFIKSIWFPSHKESNYLICVTICKGNQFEIIIHFSSLNSMQHSSRFVNHVELSTILALRVLYY